MACSRAMSIMNSVRVLPKADAASSINCRTSLSIRRLMLPFAAEDDDRSADVLGDFALAGIVV